MLRSIIILFVMTFSLSTNIIEAQSFALNTENSIDLQLQDIIAGLDFPEIENETSLNLEFEVSPEGQIVHVLVKGGDTEIHGKIKNKLLGKWLYDTEESWVAIGRRYTTELHILRV